MRRVVLALGGTIAGLVMLLSFRTHMGSTAVAGVSGSSGTAGTPGTPGTSAAGSGNSAGSAGGAAAAGPPRSARARAPGPRLPVT